MRISDWSSDVCSSDLLCRCSRPTCSRRCPDRGSSSARSFACAISSVPARWREPESSTRQRRRSEEHTSELQSLMRISYAVFCLKKKNKHKKIYTQQQYTKQRYKNKQSTRK